MAIPTPQGFDLQGQEPLETKTNRPTLISRDNITLTTRYEGLTVYVVETHTSYRLENGVGNINWIEQIFAPAPFISISTGVSDAGKPVLLNSLGKIDSSMLTASDLTLYYLLDGTRSLTGDMNVNGNKLTNISPGVSASDAVVVSQLSGFVPSGGTATNSSNLGGQDASYYLNYANFIGTINNANLPTTINSNITGNAATATTAGEWTIARLLTLSGGVSGAVNIKGNAAMSMFTIVADNSHNHIVSNITGTATAFNKNFGTTAGTVATGDHVHTGYTSFTCSPNPIPSTVSYATRIMTSSGYDIVALSMYYSVSITLVAGTAIANVNSGFRPCEKIIIWATTDVGRDITLQIDTTGLITVRNVFGPGVAVNLIIFNCSYFCL